MVDECKSQIQLQHTNMSNDLIPFLFKLQEMSLSIILPTHFVLCWEPPRWTQTMELQMLNNYKKVENVTRVYFEVNMQKKFTDDAWVRTGYKSAPMTYLKVRERDFQQKYTCCGF